MVNTLNKKFLRFSWELSVFFIEKTGKLQLTQKTNWKKWCCNSVESRALGVGASFFFLCSIDIPRDGIGALKKQSSEPENIAVRPMLRYGPQNYTSIGETAIQVRWCENTMYSDRKQNIMPSLSLLWIFACDKTIRDTQKWSFKEKKMLQTNRQTLR